MTSPKVDELTLAFKEVLHIRGSTEGGTESRYPKNGSRWTYWVVCLPATQAATCERELKPNLSQMFLTWLSAVRSER
jgi:hypothetical protein